MATLKQIRQRIRAAKNIQQITQAMKLVAAARLKKAQDRVEQARPYSQKMREFMGSIGGGDSLPNHPLLARREIKKATLVLVTADRGLAGAYNANLLRTGQNWLKQQPFEVEMLAIGKKGNQFFGKRGVEIVEYFSVPNVGAGLDDAKRMTDFVSQRFTNGETDAVFLLYSKFFSPIRQVPEVVQLLPIEPPARDENEAERKKDYDFEPNPEELLELLLPQYLLTVGLQALLESTASEHGARMTAMTSATDNAGQMIDDLTLKANRARQADITKQILEIVGGAEALKS